MKITYNNIIFDSELEISYYQYLEDTKYLLKGDLSFIYHPGIPIKINSKNTYTPDFIVIYPDKIEIIETKGYNQFSYVRDNMIHNVMLEKTRDELVTWLKENDVIVPDNKEVIYKKIKYLKSYGWVDYDFKNPNTLANKRKNKIQELNTELKELREYKKNNERYFSYCSKVIKGEKLTKKQVEWSKTFEDLNIKK